jgi:hypothetical protein
MKHSKESKPLVLNGIFEKNHLYTISYMIETDVFAKLACLNWVVNRPEDIIQMAKDGVNTVRHRVWLAESAAKQFECKGLSVILSGLLKNVDTFGVEEQELVLGELLIQAKVSMLHLYAEEVANIALVFLTTQEKNIYSMNLPFGDLTDVFGADAMKDSLEAAKCLAVNRWTSSAYHTFRVMECVTHNLAKRLKTKLIAVDKRGRKYPKGMGQLANEMLHSIDTKNKYYSSVKELVRIAKLRNAIDHAHKTGKTIHYTPKEASEVFNESSTFLKDLALLMSK